MGSSANAKADAAAKKHGNSTLLLFACSHVVSASILAYRLATGTDARDLPLFYCVWVGFSFTHLFSVYTHLFRPERVHRGEGGPGKDGDMTPMSHMFENELGAITLCLGAVPILLTGPSETGSPSSEVARALRGQAMLIAAPWYVYCAWRHLVMQPGGLWTGSWCFGVTMAVIWGSAATLL